jgi:hypothetical protein
LLIVPSAFLGSRGAKAQLPEAQNTGTLLKTKGDPTENLVLITLPTMSDANQAMVAPVAAITPRFSLNKKTMISAAELEPLALPDINILTLDEEQPSQSAGDGADAAEQARLLGIYSGQIRARIERLWRRPRTPVSDSAGAGQLASAVESFQCQVQIVQDETGRVREVLLPQCNGSPAWQRSLVVAIQQASPLPAPPSPRVFNRSIAMNFVGVPYDSDSAAEDYEIEAPPSAQVAAQRSPSAVFDELRADAKSSDRGSVPNNLRSRN